MGETEHTPQGQNSHEHTPLPFDMEAMIGTILLVGVLLSVILIVVGLVWYGITTGSLTLNFTIKGMNLFNFLQEDFQQFQSGNVKPGLFIDLGIAALLLTPFVRVLVSVFYFMIAERNWKFVLFTGFVCSVLIYSLFVR
jgi:uncharacterized membrane protein